MTLEQRYAEETQHVPPVAYFIREKYADKPNSQIPRIYYSFGKPVWRTPTTYNPKRLRIGVELKFPRNWGRKIAAWGYVALTAVIRLIQLSAAKQLNLAGLRLIFFQRDRLSQSKLQCAPDI
jgi:hypothetical protein